MKDAPPLVFVDFHCPNSRCNRFFVRIPKGTPIQNGYCKGCGLRYTNQVA